MGDLITLTTDFGLADGYVGAMKGVIKAINPGADIVDISHEVAPQDILEASYVLGTTYRYFPSSTVHIVVVDPGVGTERAAVLLVTPSGLFLGPDNGVLSHVLMDLGLQGGSPEDALFALYQTSVPAKAKAYRLSDTKWWLPQVSHTFHGRDIFAPVGARLSLGLPPHLVGEQLYSLTAINVPKPYRPDGNTVMGHVVHIDRFGNLITTITEKDIPSGDVVVEVGDVRIHGLSNSYEAAGELLAILGSTGALEIAHKRGSAQKKLGAQRGTQVVVRSNG